MFSSPFSAKLKLNPGQHRTLPPERTSLEELVPRNRPGPGRVHRRPQAVSPRGAAAPGPAPLLMPPSCFVLDGEHRFATGIKEATQERGRLWSWPRIQKQSFGTQLESNANYPQCWSWITFLIRELATAWKHVTYSLIAPCTTLLRLVYTYDASTSAKGTRACACVVPVHTWLMLVLMLMLASHV